ncbi:MAG TPA: TonB-dependent receptor [Bacteroidales bacterium]|nr:TonB-dependent receptor [Bacteroidales bacterium]
MQQQKTVSGTITDAVTGEPMPGVNVLLLKTTVGAITDVNGKYTIQVPDLNNAVLGFSFLGYTNKEVNVSGKSVIDLALESSITSLDEVVVVGYGTQKKETLTGAITQQRGEEIKRTPSLNLSNTLTGMFTGLKTINTTGAPGSDVSSILIRGESTLGNTSPLIVIDGVAERGGLNQIDPRDIESVSILKDASAAIYGARAANGVIIITTKRGQTGKPSVSYNYNQGFTTPTRVPEFTNSWDLAQFQNEQLSIYGQPEKWTPDQIQKFRDGSDPLNYPNIKYHDLMIKKVSLQSRHNISVRGGTNDVKYFVSANYSNQESMFKYSDNNFQTIGLRSNVDATISENLSVYLDLSFNETNNNAPGEDYDEITSATYNAYPYQHMFFPNGLPGDGVRGEGDNPALMASDASGYSRRKVNMYQTKLGFNFNTPVKGLSLNGYVAYDVDNDFRKNFRKPWTVYLHNSATDIYTPVSASRSPRTELLEQYNFSSNIIGNLKLNYQLVDVANHNFSAFVAAELGKDNNNWFNAERRNFTSPAVDQIFAGDPSQQFTDGNAGEFARMNIFGRVSEVYKGKYMVDVNLRYDGSTAFPKDKRWGFFPGVSVGWILSQEGFIKNNVSFMKFLKIRGSYGIMGNDRINPFQFLRTYQFTSGEVFGTNRNLVTGLSQNVEPNPNVTWEIAKTSNIGLDAILWDGLLGITFDAFHTERSNILSIRDAAIPQFSGLILPSENIGIVTNKGFELELSNTKQVGDFRYRISANVSRARNNVVYTDEPDGVLPYQKVEGMPIGAELNLIVLGIYRTQAEIDNSPHWVGTVINDLQYKDVDDNGVINNNDRVRQNKTALPEYMFGTTLRVDYKNFDMSMLWQGATKVWHRIWLPQGVFGNVLQDVFDNRPWSGNPDSKYPNVTYDASQVSALNSEFNLMDASYLRLKNMELGYNFSKNSLQRLGIADLRIYMNGFNLITFDKIKWFDPEGDDSRGRFYPQNKIYNVGLSITF